MAYFVVTWSIKKAELVEADDFAQAKEAVENMDCVLEGMYVDNSFAFEDVQQIDTSLVHLLKDMMDRGEIKFHKGGD